MGAGESSNINIRFDRSDPYFYAGESLSGTVSANITDDKIEAHEIYVLLTGEVGYQTTRTVYKPNPSTNIHNPHHPHHHHSMADTNLDPYHTMHMNSECHTASSSCHIPNSTPHTETQVHNVAFLSEKQQLETTKSGQSEIVYSRGQYSWQFEILLPKQLPPSLNESNRYPYVRYYLKFVIDRAWYKTNIDKTVYLTVFPPLLISKNPHLLESSIFGNHNRKDVALKGVIDKIGYEPGETITGTLEIDNPNKILVKSIHAAIYQNYQVESSNGKVKIIEMVLPGIVSRRDDYITEKFRITLPFQQFAPSCHFVGGFRQHVSVHVDYFLELNVKVEGMFTNFDISLPITIGTAGTNVTAESHRETGGVVHDLISLNKEKS